MRRHATKSAHRCSGCAAAHHLPGDRAAEDFPGRCRSKGVPWASRGCAERIPERLLRLGADPQPLPSAAEDRQHPDQDRHALELVRYIHLNPLRVRLVESLDQLDCYPYGGHSALMGKCPNDWQDVDTILSLFGRRLSSARDAYRSFVEKAVAVGRRPELTGGGLIRSVGGWGALKSLG